MRRIALLLVLLLAAPAAAQQRASLPDIEDEVMCLVCGTSLAVAEAPAADQERKLIRRLIADGLTKQQIKDRLVDEYGPEVLALPEDKGFDLAVYLVPAVLLVGGIAGVAVVSRRWRRRGPAPAVAELPELDPADAARLEQELAER